MKIINDDVNARIEAMQNHIHNTTMEDLKRKENYSSQNVARATQELAQAQFRANEIQLKTIQILQEQQQELKRRNEILEADIKSSNTHNKIMLVLTISSTLIALGAMIAAFIK